MYNLFKVLFFSLVFLITTLVAQSTSKGKISGTAVDAETGDPLIGANVYLENTSLGSASDLDGNFLIMGVPTGNYTLVVSVVGYAETKITDVIVKNDEITKISLAVQPEILSTDVVVVEAKALQNTEASLLKSRQKAVAVSDAISAEEISKSGSGDAAAAMKKVTGASVVGGKYVYIRGLGDRYSATTLNGAEVPSADPDKKSFQLDLIPSNMLDNINTIKTFTPDKPGTFTGGLVDVTLKSYPEQFTLQVNTAVGYNSVTTGNDNFILSNSGGTDWLGMDDGTRDLPNVAKDYKEVDFGPGMTAEDAVYYDKYSTAFNRKMYPISSNAPLNSSFGISIGNTYYIGLDQRNSIGYFGSLSWGQNYSFIENGEAGRYKLIGNLPDVTSLSNTFAGKDTRGNMDVNWGSIANIAYKNTTLGELKFSYMHTQNVQSEGRSLVGRRDSDSETRLFHTSSIAWIERSLDTYQLGGEHLFSFLNDSKLDWKVSRAVNNQTEPDRRYFFYVTEVQPDNSIEYQFDSANNIPITRFYRDLEEDNVSTTINLSMPFKQWNGYNSKIKLGFASTTVDRTYDQRRFQYEANSRMRLNDFAQNDILDKAALFNNVGIVDTTASRLDRQFGFHIEERTSLTNFFRGEMNTIAYYGMIDLPLIEHLRFIGGARVENSVIDSRTLNPEDEKGKLDDTDILPSVNFVYALSSNMNLRTSYSKTIARPTFRELAPYESFEFVGDFRFKGNANLKRTLISNYDLRWEWFISPGEIIAVSGFYKDFQNPIEKTITYGSGDDLVITMGNVEKGRIYGMEFEARKSLGFITEHLSDFKMGTNISYIDAEVEIPNAVKVLNYAGGDSVKTRSFPGQSPYLFNVNLSYENFASATTAGFFYNFFGDRLFITGRYGTPDVFEKGYSSLDFKATQGIFNRISISFSAKNLLNPTQKYIYTLKNDLVNKEYVYQSYKKGITYSFSINYKL